jgi:DNA gyrase subunit A
MEIGLVRKINIDDEMQQAYLDYAMSVIVSRALPDARDGLKPVHRRILYAMYDMGLRPDTSYKKSARVVGEVLGKYHPHSDTAVYDAMARMVQDFSLRYPLVDGQGNFGSVDGDPPAAMRYTEARLAAPSMDIMADIQKATVDFTPNFDATMDEPTVLPAAIPNLLVNGATGIAVGMSTSIPPHNLGEVIDAIDFMLQNWRKVDDINVEDLMKFIKGPDFPTGGVILGGLKEEGLSSAYGKGRGRIVVQARAHVEEMGRGRERIIVTELPYMTNKSSLIGRIAKLARDGKLEGISDLRDESDRQGMRIVIELGKNANTEDVLESLYKRTPMQNTFSINILALVEGEPRLLSLKQALTVYIQHRLEIIRRRSEFDLERARKRSHVLEGLRVALQNLDEIINLIRKSRDVDAARSRLMKRYKLSETQANAILDMPLRRLAALERKKIEQEYKEVQRLIKSLEGLLKSPKKMRDAVSVELGEVKENYGDRRRTQIVHVEEGTTVRDMLTVTDFSPDQPTWALVSEAGLISRTPEEKAPRLWGRSAPRLAVSGNTRDTLYLVSASGKTAAIAMHALPEAELSDQGVPIPTVSPLRESDKVTAIFSLPPEGERAQDWYLMTVSRGGMVKKTALGELPGPAAQTFELARTKEGDEIAWVLLTNGSDEIMLATAGGMAIRFTEEDVRPMGLVAAGVNGIKLKVGEEVVGATVLNPKFEVFLLASDGVAKRVKAAQFPTQGRYGQGVTAWKLGEGIRLVGIANDKPNAKVTLHLSKLAAKAVRLDEAPIRTRPSSGRSVVEIKTGVVALTVPWAAPGKVMELEDKPTPPKPKKPAAKAEQMQLDLDGGKKSAAKPKTKTAAKRKTAAKKTTAAKSKTKTRTKTKTKPKAKTKTKTSTSARKKTSTRRKTSTKK